MPRVIKKANYLRTRAAYGKGEMIYCSLAIAGELYEPEVMPLQKWVYRHDEKLQQLYQTELKLIFKPANIWQINAPEKVFTSLWQEQDGSIVVHLLNAQGSCMQPGGVTGLYAPKNPFPPVTEDITFVIAKKGCKNVTAYSPDFEGGRSLKFKKLKNNNVSVTLPKELMKVYTMIRLQ